MERLTGVGGLWVSGRVPWASVRGPWVSEVSGRGHWCVPPTWPPPAEPAPAAIPSPRSQNCSGNLRTPKIYITTVPYTVKCTVRGWYEIGFSENLSRLKCALDSFRGKT